MEMTTNMLLHMEINILNRDVQRVKISPFLLNVYQHKVSATLFT